MLGAFLAALMLAAAPPATVEVIASGTSFTPAQLDVGLGDTVTWRNAGGFHNVVFDDGSYRTGDPTSTQGELGSHVFDTAGSFAFYCEIHGGKNGSGMSGKVTVAGGAAPPDPTPTPAPTTIPPPSVENFVINRAVRGGLLRGTADIAPVSSDVRVRAERDGTKVGTDNVIASEGVTAFAIPLARAVRRKLKDGQRVKVTVSLVAVPPGGGLTTVRRRTLRLRHS